MEEEDQSLRWDCRVWMRERVVSEEGEVQREQVQVKWKPDWRWAWRWGVGSRGEVSVIVSGGMKGVVGGLHDMVISSPSTIFLVARTV